MIKTVAKLVEHLIVKRQSKSFLIKSQFHKLLRRNEFTLT